MRILAIDPGNIESGWCVIDANTCQPLEFDKTPNDDLLERVNTYTDQPGSLTADRIVIEMVASYGMAVGKTVFDTCVWVGRYMQAYIDGHGATVELVYRQPIKLHHCGQAKAKDSNIKQALIDRFDPHASNHGKGTQAAPGWFHGFRADIWQAYALAVYAADTSERSRDALRVGGPVGSVAGGVTS